MIDRSGLEPGLSRREAMSAGLCCAMTMTAAAASAASGPPPALPVKSMQADIALLQRAYGGLHPGLLRYNSPSTIRAALDHLSGECAKPMPLPTFYLALSRFLAGVRCGHSYANFYNQSKAVRTALFDVPDRLPFEFLWIGDQMIITRDLTGSGIEPGTRILSIDGRPAAGILARLMQMARADGHNDAKRRRLMSVQGEDRYESFDIFFSLLFGRSRYALQVETIGGRTRRLDVPALSQAARLAHMRISAAAEGSEPIWTIERRGDAAILTMGSWALYDSKWDWRSWLNQAVDRLIADRVPQLIVDVRGNEGGQDCGDELVARLIRRPVQRQAVRRLVRYRTIPADLRPFLDTWDRSFDHLGEQAKAFSARFLELPAEPGDRIQPKGPRYEGAVSVLIGPQNSSATFQFASCMKREKLGRLIGEPTGGNRRGINGGCFYFLRLPETGLECDLPLIGTFPVNAQPDAGILPDVDVPISRQSIATGSDPALHAALGRMRS